MKFTKLIIVFWLFIAVMGCRNTVDFPGSNIELSFSADTIYLDTVFTGLASSTRILKVFNNSNENMVIDRIYLGRSTESFYRMNVDGISGLDISNTEVLANDSIYIFIEISPDALGSNELIYKDSIWFENGSKRQHVDLVTTVWDAIYHFPTNVLTINRTAPLPPIKLAYSILDENEIWDNSKPHVVYGYAVVDSAHTLTIEPGTQVHFHNGSGLWVYRDGELHVDPLQTGSMNNAVVFQGDRLEPSYEWVPGQWGGLLGGVFIQGGSATKATLSNLIIKNATTALRVDSAWNTAPNAELNNVIITHSSRVSLYGGYANVTGRNLAIGPSGVYGIYALGGNYLFEHCSINNTWSFSSRSGSGIGLVNFFDDANNNRYTRAIQASFSNSFIGGNLSSEVALGIDPLETFDVSFEHCAIEIEPNPEAGHYALTDTTMFKSSEFNLNWDFLPCPWIPQEEWKLVPDSSSTLFGKAIPTPFTPVFDLGGNVRQQPATIGALERP